MTDYGIVLLTHFARCADNPTRSARDLSAEAHIPQPTVSKVLKVLARNGLLVAHRGVKGGFGLARAPERITLTEIIDALEGPIAITECSNAAPAKCSLEQHCPVGRTLRNINLAVRDALRGITLAQLARPLAPQAIPVAFGSTGRMRI